MQDGTGNFKLYEVYSTRVNLEEYVHRRYETIKVDLLPYPYKGEQYLVVKLADGVDEIGIPLELSAQLQQFLVNLDTRYCPILTSSKSISYKNIVLPTTWLASILNFVELAGHDFIYRDGILYADLSRFQMYNLVRERLIREVLDILHKLYIMGTAVLHTTEQSYLIKKWELLDVTIADYLDFGQTIPEARLIDALDQYKIYRLSGYSATFAPDPTLFLQELAVGTRWFKINISPDISARYSVAKSMIKHDIVAHMYDDYVLVEPRSLVEMLRISHYIDKAVASRTLVDGIYEITDTPRGSLIAGAKTTHHYVDESNSHIVEFFDRVAGASRIDKTMAIPTV